MALSESDIKKLLDARKQGEDEFRSVLEDIWSSPEGQNPPFPVIRNMGEPVIEPDVQAELDRLNGVSDGDSSR